MTTPPTTTPTPTDDPLIEIPTNEIDAEALPRDRARLDAAALADLKASISATGLRQPIEVWKLSQPHGDYKYGLISGLRRLTAHRDLKKTPIRAFLRQPKSIPHAMAEMIAENEVRSDISAWEKGQILVNARDEGLFETLDAAVAGLHPLANGTKRSRLRALAMAVETFSGLLSEPTLLSQRQVLRLANLTRTKLTHMIDVALTAERPTTPEEEWSIIEPILTEAELSLRTPQPNYAPGRPRRLLKPRPGLMVRREMAPQGWTLRFTGPDATGFLIERVLDEIETLFTPPPQ